MEYNHNWLTSTTIPRLSSSELIRYVSRSPRWSELLRACRFNWYGHHNNLRVIVLHLGQVIWSYDFRLDRRIARSGKSIDQLKKVVQAVRHILCCDWYIAYFPHPITIWPHAYLCRCTFWKVTYTSWCLCAWQETTEYCCEMEIERSQ